MRVLPPKIFCGALFGCGVRGLQLAESQSGCDVECHHLEPVLLTQLIQKRHHRIFGSEQFSAISHAARNINDEHIIHAVLPGSHILAGRKCQAKETFLTFSP